MHVFQHRFMLFMLAALVFPLPAQAQPEYAYTATGLTPYKSLALSISNSGNVTGHTHEQGGQGFLYSAQGFTGVGRLPGTFDSIGRGVNNAGHVVGASHGPEFARGFLYADGVMTDLGTLGGAYSEAFGINDVGQIVGISHVGQFIRAFLYQDGVMTSLGTLPGASNSQAAAINNHGQITGSADYQPFDPYQSPLKHAILYENGVMKDLGSLGGPFSRGYGINDKGHVVGTSGTIPDNREAQHAFLYVDGVMYDLGTPMPGTSSEARGINNLGQVVGWYSAPDGRAFLYRQTGEMRDLGSMVDPASGWYIHAAYGINDRQQIVALGCKDGQYGAVLLNPTHRDGMVAAGPGATAGSPPAGLVVGAPENPACGPG